MNYYLKSRSINLDKYDLQLNKLKWAIHQKWPKLAKHQRQCISSRQRKSCFGHPTRHKLLEHIWNVFFFLYTYSPCFVLSNYRLFRSLQNSLDNFTSLEDKKINISFKNFQYFIVVHMQLPDIWHLLYWLNVTFSKQNFSQEKGIIFCFNPKCRVNSSLFN